MYKGQRLALTSNDDLGGVRKTGYYVGEAAHPWKEFVDAGFDVDVAKYIAKELGKTPVFSQAPTPQRETLIKTGQVDYIVGEMNSITQRINQTLTELDNAAKMHLSEWTSDAQQTYQFIVSHYPQTEYAYRAKARLSTLEQLGQLRDAEPAKVSRAL